MRDMRAARPQKLNAQQCLLRDSRTETKRFLLTTTAFDDLGSWSYLYAGRSFSDRARRLSDLTSIHYSGGFSAIMLHAAFAIQGVGGPVIVVCFLTVNRRSL